MVAIWRKGKKQLNKEGVCRCFDSRIDDQWGLSARWRRRRGPRQVRPNGVTNIKKIDVFDLSWHSGASYDLSQLLHTSIIGESTFEASYCTACYCSQRAEEILGLFRRPADGVDIFPVQ